MSNSVPTTDTLIELAALSIRAGLDAPGPGRPDLAGCPAPLLELRACFVTLSSPREGLRGCRGMLAPSRPLAEDVWHNAWASAFDDPRFPAVTRAELDELEIEVAVLGPLAPVAAGSEEELRRLLVPGVDGLVLSWRGRRATFLPKVWEMLPDPGEFLRRLKLKAGLPARFWAPDIEIQRYSTTSVCGRLVRTTASASATQ